MEDLLQRVNKNTDGIYNKNSELITTVDEDISVIIGDHSIHISEFIIAKVKGKSVGLVGHPEITDEIFLRIPFNLSNPQEIIQDIRSPRKYLFINSNPQHEIVVEVFRKESGKTEINTLHLISIHKLKQLESRFPVVYSSGGTS